MRTADAKRMLPWNDRWDAWGICTLLAVAALAAHLPSLDNDFLSFDDPQFVRESPEVMSGLRASSVRWAFTSIEAANWFPITRLSWILDAELYGRDPAGYHATNVALHVVNAVLFFVALWRLTRAHWPSAFVALVFAVHPLHVESVAWISTRKDMLSGLFFVICLLCYERRVRGDRPRAWGAALVGSYALGLMSKPVLVTLPCLLLLLDVWPLDRWRRTTVPALLREKVPLFVLSLVACGITVLTQNHALQTTEMFPLLTRFQNAMVVYFDYIGRAVWPVDLMVLYPLSRDVGLRLYWTPPALALLCGLAFLSVRRHPWFFVGWFWFFGMLVPTIGIVQVGAQASADRYTYLPLAGVSIIAAWGGRELLSRLASSWRRPAVALVAVGVCTVGMLWIRAAREQTRLWKDDLSLWGHAMSIAPDSYGVRFRYALFLHDAGHYEASIPHYQAALRLAPNFLDLRADLEKARAGRPRAGH